jgi:hypothetical protein
MHNDQPNNKKKILIIAIVVVIVIAGYMFLKDDAPEASETLSVAPTDDTIGGDILPLLYQLKSLQLDTTIFRDPAFATLQDYSIEIPDQPQGRENPFAPIGARAVGTTTQLPPIRLPLR